MDYKYMLLKLITGFIMLIIYIRISGKSQLSPLTPSDQVGNMVIGAMVSTAIISPDVTVSEGIILVTMWAALQIAVRFIKFKSSNAMEFFDGSPIQLIKDGVLIKEGFINAQVSILDFETHIHEKGIKSISEVKNAWLETSGIISVDKKGEKSQSNVIIYDGTVFTDTLYSMGIDKKEFIHRLKNEGYRAKDIICAEVFDGDLIIYLNDGHEIIEDF